MPTIDKLVQLVTAVRIAELHVDDIHERPMSRNREVSELIQEEAVHAERIARYALRDYLFAHYPDPGRGEPFAVVLSDGSIVTYHVGDVAIVRPEHIHRIATSSPTASLPRP